MSIKSSDSIEINKIDTSFVIENINKINNECKNKLLVHGQGIILFKNNNNDYPCIIFVYNKDYTNGLKFELTCSNVIVSQIYNNTLYVDINNNSGLSELKGAYYWISIDSQNQYIYVGVGEARLETVIYKYSFSHDFKLFLESLCNIRIYEESKYLKLMKLLRDPITLRIPLIIKNIDELSMIDIAKGAYMPKSNLSIVAQKLYDCISGKNFILNDADFPDFSDAIEYSIKTKGLWCNTTLNNKSREFNKDKPNLLETYLRITLGKNNGESPGIPYVMEIWPSGHYSPVHNHGDSSAIIRVLHGNINVKLFPFLCENNDFVKPFSEQIFRKNDITWISPTLNQVHQLVNKQDNIETCITIQCYMYETENTRHYDYFDYIDNKNHIQQFEPDSDMDFIQFREIIKEEWVNRKNSFNKNILKFNTKISLNCCKI